MNTLSLIDPLKNVVLFDKNSIGFAVLNSELSSFVHDILRSTIEDPVAIVEVDSTKRVYMRMNKNMDIRVVNVVLKDAGWYAEEVDIELNTEDLLDLIKSNTVIFKK